MPKPMKRLPFVILFLLAFICADARRRFVPPTVVSKASFVSASIVGTHYDRVQIVFSGNVTTSSGYTMTTSGSAPFTTLSVGSLLSGSGTNTLVWQLNRNVTSTVTEATLTVSGSGGTDLNSFSSQSCTNGSAVVLLDSVGPSPTNGNGFALGYNAGHETQGNVYTPANTRTVVMITANILKVGAPPFSVGMYLYNTSAGAPSTVNGTGSTTFLASTLLAVEPAVTESIFPLMVASTTASTAMAAVIVPTGTLPDDATNYVQWSGKGVATTLLRYYGPVGPPSSNPPNTNDGTNQVGTFRTWGHP